MKLSEHFDDYEFTCKCGCGKNNVKQELVDKLEQLFALMDARVIIVTSGCRCAVHSVRVGGSATDGHTCGIAADIQVQKKDGSWYSGYDIAEAAERIGFTGIGVMNGACHVDIRNSDNYVNSHWFGSEIDGNDWVETFQRGTKFPGQKEVTTTDLQLALIARGYDCGPADGIIGPKTTEAMKKALINLWF